MESNFGIYIHIPFCKQKCFYCDFPSFAGRERLIDKYLTELSREMALTALKYGQDGKMAPYTVYIGGGTPSWLDTDQLAKLFSAADEYIRFDQVAEFTIEANPGTLTKDKLRLMKESGVNRISIGVQSFDDNCLKKIGRIHRGKDAIESIQLAQQLGFNNISIDLMYGLPGQDMDILKKSVEQAVALQVQHISVYGLQLEDGTVFARQQAMGKLQLPTDELVEAMYDYVAETLPAGGYNRYEISNYALSGYESKHNSLYWQDVPYLGFGAGAHAYWQGNRYENPTNIDAYMAMVRQGDILSNIEEKVDEKAHMEEFCFLGLRMTKGIDKEKFRETFNKDIYAVFDDSIKEMMDKGFLQEKEGALSLTKIGMKYGNIVFGAFITGE